MQNNLLTITYGMKCECFYCMLYEKLFCGSPSFLSLNWICYLSKDKILVTLKTFPDVPLGQRAHSAQEKNSCYCSCALAQVCDKAYTFISSFPVIALEMIDSCFLGMIE